MPPATRRWPSGFLVRREAVPVEGTGVQATSRPGPRIVGRCGVAGVKDSILMDQPALLPELDTVLVREYKVRSDTQIAKIWERCKDDPEFFIFGGFVRTFDEHDRISPRKEFPRKKYLYKVLNFIHDTKPGDVCAVAKSRQLMVTWIVVAYAVWEAKFHPQSRVMIQTKKADDAWSLVYRDGWYHSRSSFIERAMPEFLRSRGLKGTIGKLAYPEGSSIWGIPQGPDMFRSYTATLVICDECCFQPEFEAAYKAALPMCKGNPNVEGSGGRIVLISSAAPGTYFGRLIGQELQNAA